MSFIVPTVGVRSSLERWRNIRGLRTLMMRNLLEDTAQRAIAYLDGLNDRGVAPAAEAVANLQQLDQPLNEESTSPDEVIALLDQVCSPATMAMAGPRFFGFVIGGSLPVTLAANGPPAPRDQTQEL